MKIFSAAQIKQWDEYTMQHEPVSSLGLMERAATKCAEWVIQHTDLNKNIIIYCGPGNNGGDGLVIARILLLRGRKVQVYFVDGSQSADFKSNFERLLQHNISPVLLSSPDLFPEHRDEDIIIDALFGYGLNRPLSGIADVLVKHINQSKATIVSIDIPSGLFADKSSKGNTIAEAAHTLTFQIMKLAFLLPENAPCTGEVTVLDIGLHRDFYNHTDAAFEITSHKTIHNCYSPRKRFSHKGTYGSAALIAGSHGMMGAAVLGAQSCMRSGAGKLTCYIPKCGYAVLQSTVPEAMCVTDENETHHTSLRLKMQYDAYAIGPGIGQSEATVAVLKTLLQQKPARLIIDADGLNILAAHPSLLGQLPANTILTPHPKEFEKLFGKAENDFDRMQLALDKAKALQAYIVLKGFYSFIATPGGKGYFNPTGNPGMATAGSGDVLTGILLGLYAQTSDPEKVVVTGVYLHGLAGDVAAVEKSEEGLIAGDIADYLPRVWLAIKKPEYFR
ncbi:bifunctional ADP-dependent NAD(P)H-hydrate dehydratase/NAD(P)H-hydrate epimerase [Terrimonas sp.]|uniref:NAD(P)H-hydrate dehydratase n=1 Tax=Terrimonas sp. TaxID=1914338 RepID=UPI000D524967|nr:NAD(P)H-hydrate dehydratase [Terrimonas sp.]PVD53030.1 bifunctional ADP-dependent NAD(P)H-hydrate dehydratase/NAD(P)H-hydrate epimerase [Terrimonas sp.]